MTAATHPTAPGDDAPLTNAQVAAAYLDACTIVVEDAHDAWQSAPLEDVDAALHALEAARLDMTKAQDALEAASDGDTEGY